MKRWYWASALFIEIHAPEIEEDDVLCERIVFLLQASSDAEAKELSGKIALSKEHSYESVAGRVTWTLKAIERVEPRFDDVLAEGTEVFWQYLSA